VHRISKRTFVLFVLYDRAVSARAASEGPTVARKGAATRAAILERAVDLASAEGLEGLTIGGLAAELRMSKSGLFAHFGSKQELQLATVGAAAERFRAAVLEPALALPEGAERLRAICEGYLDNLDLYAGGCFWAATSTEYDDRPGPVRDAIAAALDAWVAELARQAEIAGVRRPERFAFELYSVVMGANSRYRLSGDPRVLEYAREALARLEAELDRPGGPSDPVG
jgi:AcrR family transcriptional regulator